MQVMSDLRAHKCSNALCTYILTEHLQSIAAAADRAREHQLAELEETLTAIVLHVEKLLATAATATAQHSPYRPAEDSSKVHTND